MSDGLRNCLAIAGDPRTAMKLMGSSKTRPLLVARVVNQLIVDFAFRPNGNVITSMRKKTPEHWQYGLER